jgi:hypothetical protein
VPLTGQTATGFQVAIASGAGAGYTLSVSVTGSGTVASDPSAINCSAGTCGTSFPGGTTVTLTATPAGGYQLGSWSGCQSTTGTQCTVQMTQARAVSVTFTPAAATGR